MFCNEKVQQPASVPNVGLQTLIAGNAAHHTFTLPFWNGVFQMDQLLSQSPERVKGDRP